MSGACQHEITPEERRKYELEQHLASIPASQLDVQRLTALLYEILSRLPEKP